MRYLVLLLFCGVVCHASAQSKLPVIKATSKSVSIRDGDFFDKNMWSLSPSARPDVYTADRSRKPKWVVFYTDIDSIRVKVTPGSKFNFVVLLNGKDTCFTRIDSAIPVEQERMVRNDTIPFTLTSYNAIAIKALVNGTDSVVMHFDLSSFDFHLTREGILNKTHLLKNQPDALAGKVAPNYNRLAPVERVQMGSAVWITPPLSVTNLAAHEMDGRVGWNMFEGKKVELNYDTNQIIVSSYLPKDRKGYVKAKLGFGRTFPYIKGDFPISEGHYEGNFAMDNGSELAMILDSVWVAKKNFPIDFKPLKTTVIHDATGKKYETRTVMFPAFALNGFKQTNIPALIASNRINPSDYEMNFLGNDLLKRFNMIIDFKNDEIYLKPNHLWDVKYKG